VFLPLVPRGWLLPQPLLLWLQAQLLHQVPLVDLGVLLLVVRLPPWLLQQRAALVAPASGAWPWGVAWAGRAPAAAGAARGALPFPHLRPPAAAAGVTVVSWLVSVAGLAGGNGG
jgi:hypothetical protein